MAVLQKRSPGALLRELLELCLRPRKSRAIRLCELPRHGVFNKPPICTLLAQERLRLVLDEEAAKGIHWQAFLGDGNVGAKAAVDRGQVLVLPAGVVRAGSREKLAATAGHAIVEPLPGVLLELLAGPVVAGLVAVTTVGLQPRHRGLYQEVKPQLAHHIRRLHAFLQQVQSRLAAGMAVVVDGIFQAAELLARCLQPSLEIAGMSPDAVVCSQ